MNINLEQVNAMPVRTWSWLNINDRTIKEEIPEILSYGKDPLRSNEVMKDDTLPFAIYKEYGYMVGSNSNINKSILASTVEKVSNIPTGMGVTTANFLKENQNAGVFIRIPSGVKQKEPIFLHYDLDEYNRSVADVNTIYAEEDSEVTIVMQYTSEKGIPVFHGGLTYLYAEKNATIHLIQIQLFSEEALHFNDIGAVIEDGGAINLVHTELGGKKAYNGCKADLKGSNSKINIETIYFGDKDRTIDINYVMNHYGKHSNSQIHVNGALLDQSSKTFRGTIDFKKGAVGSIGHEEEYNLLFSPKIKNLTAPLILCAEEDVEGKHGANSGKIDENKLFYMMSRGLDELSAKKLMIEAAFRPAMEKIPFTDVQDQISEYVKERLNNIESI